MMRMKYLLRHTALKNLIIMLERTALVFHFFSLIENRNTEQIIDILASDSVRFQKIFHS